MQRMVDNADGWPIGAAMLASPFNKLVNDYGGLVFVCVDYRTVHSCDRLEDLVVFHDCRSIDAECMPLYAPPHSALLVPDDIDAQPAVLHLRVSHDVVHKIYTQMSLMRPKADADISECEDRNFFLMPRTSSGAFQALMVVVSEHLSAHPPLFNEVSEHLSDNPPLVSELDESGASFREVLEYEKQTHVSALARLRNFPFKAVRECMWTFRYAIFRYVCAQWNVLHGKSEMMKFGEFKVALATNKFEKNVHSDIASRYSSLQLVFGFFDKSIADVVGHLASAADAKALSHCCRRFNEAMDEVFCDIKAVITHNFPTTQKDLLSSTIRAYQNVDLHAAMRKLLDPTASSDTVDDEKHTRLTPTTPIDAFQLLRKGLEPYRTAVGNNDMRRIGAVYGCHIMLRMPTKQANQWFTAVQLLSEAPFTVDPAIPIAILQTDDFTLLGDVYAAGFRPLMASSSWSSDCYYEASAVMAGKVALSKCAAMLERILLNGDLEEPAGSTSVGVPFPIRAVSEEAQHAHSLEYEKFMRQLATEQACRCCIC